MVEHEAGLLRWLLPKVVPGGIAKITANQGIGRKSTEQLLVDVQRHVQAVDDLVAGGDWLVGAILDDEGQPIDIAAGERDVLVRDVNAAGEVTVVPGMAAVVIGIAMICEWG